MRLVRLLPAVLAVLVLAPLPAAAAEEPACLTARLIVPWGAGGGTDLIFRALADAINRTGAKPAMEVVNLSGEDGVRGTREAARAKPDGCTLLAVHQSLMTSYIAGLSELNWDSFTPLARLTRTATTITARAEAPFASLTEMLDATGSGAGVTAGSTRGLTSQFLFLLVTERTGKQFKPMFFEGTRERLSALLAGQVDIAEVNLATVRRLAPEAGLKVLATTGTARATGLPDVPTLKEQGVNLVFGTERGVLLPKGAKPDLVDRYAGLFEKALKDKQVAALLHDNDTDAAFLGPKAYPGYWQDTYAEWRRVAKDAGLYERSE